MTMLSFLREAVFTYSIFAGIAVLAVAFPAYKRTKFMPLALIIWSDFGGIILECWMHIHKARGFISIEDNQMFEEVYRVCYLVLGILGTVGSLLLVRRFMVMHDRKDDHAA